MKKIILMILITFIGIFAFNLNAEAKDQTLTLKLSCQYKATGKTFNGTSVTIVVKTNLYCNEKTGCIYKGNASDAGLTEANNYLTMNTKYGTFTSTGGGNIANSGKYEKVDKCPNYVAIQIWDSDSIDTKVDSLAKKYFVDSQTDPYSNVKARNTVFLPLIVSTGGGNQNDPDFNMPTDTIASFCTETSKMWKIFGYLVNALKVLVPAIIIVMGSLDLGKAVTAQNEDDIKKGTQLLVKRIIAGVIIFFIPTIINIVFKMVAERSSYISNSGACIECITSPGSC